LFHHTLVSELAVKEFVAINDTSTIEEALETLANHHILSAPVICFLKNLCLGSVDVLDLITFLMDVPSIRQDWFPDVRDRYGLPVSKAVNYSLVDPFVPIDFQQPLRHVVVNQLANGIHRVPIMKDGKLWGILTQFDVVVWLRYQMDRAVNQDIKDLSRMTVHQLDLTQKEVYAVRDKDTILQAFLTLINNALNSLAVVDLDGHLLGNLSASDFEGVKADMLPALANRELKDVIEGQPLYYVDKEATLHDVVKMISDTKKHRVYIVDKSYRPIGLVTLTDVIKIASQTLNL